MKAIHSGVAVVFLAIAGCSTQQVGPLQRLHDEDCSAFENRFACARHVEGILLRPPRPDVERAGNTLRIRTASAATVTFVDSPEDADENTVSYSYVGSLPEVGYHLVEVQFYEDISYLLVAFADGAATWIEGIPVVSPTRRRLAVTYGGSSGRGIQILRVTGDGLVSELDYTFDGTPYEVSPARWLSDQKLEFTKSAASSRKNRTVTLTLDESGWSSPDLPLISQDCSPLDDEPDDAG